MEASSAPTQSSGGIMCAQHTTVLAAHSCQRCGLPMCGLCAFEFNKQWLCPNCIGQAAATNPVAAYPTARPAYGYPAAQYAPAPVMVAGTRCVQHPNVAATQQCKMCGAYMCSTCDFALPGGAHICPTCAAAPKTNLSPRRKKMMIAAYVMAGIGTLAMAVVFSGALAGMADDKSEVAALGGLMMIFILVPAIIGTCLGFGAMDKRLPTPISLWIATIWNGIILACFALLMIIGMAKG
jgi:hypothetical protein